MITDILTNAIDDINRDLSNPNLNYLHHGKYLRIIKVRQAMAALRDELETEWADEEASRQDDLNAREAEDAADAMEAEWAMANPSDLRQEALRKLDTMIRR